MKLVCFFKKFEIFFPFPQTVSVIRKDILSSPLNWDDLHPHAKLALRANDSHLASWLISKQQMLIRCTLGRHPSQEVHGKRTIKDRGRSHTEHRRVDRDWRLALLPLTKTFPFTVLTCLCTPDPVTYSDWVTVRPMLSPPKHVTL